MPSDIATLREYVESNWERILTRHRYHAEGIYVSGREIMEEHTQLADSLLLRLLAESQEEGILPEDATLTLVALGGYGRRELNPHSDIDVTLLYDPARCPASALEKFANLLITTLWDVGFEVGHSVRTLRECRIAAFSDIDSRTAMLEGRYVAGSRRLWSAFEREIKTRAMKRGVRAFIQEKVQDWREKMGDPYATVYVQEPDLKNGVGGLREAHIARWVARARFGVWEVPDLVNLKVLPESAVDDYERALDFVWRVRNELHYLARRRMDILTFDMQERVAKAIAYVDKGRHLAEEQLMQDYYRQAYWIHECARIIIMQSRWEWSPWRRLDDRLRAKTVGSEVVVLRERVRLRANALEDAVARGEAHALLIELFALRCAHGFPLNVLTRQQIVSAMPRLGEPGSDERARFLSILAADRNIASTLREMHQLGILEHYVPGFEALRALVRYDHYHKYTVDEHTFFAVGNVEASALESAHHGTLLAETFAELSEGERLTLRFAVLLHDIGKGAAGEESHVPKGARIVEETLRLFPAVSDEQRGDIRFLVEQHLLMSHTAQRRNLDDPEVIERFAMAVGSLRRLRLLFLLTFADIRAVNPDLWTDWTATLLAKLYNRAWRFFRGEFLAAPQDVETARNALVERMGTEWAERVERHFEMMGAERMAFFAPDEMEAQVRAVDELARRPCVIRLFAKSANYSSVVFVAPDRPGLFAQIAGVLAAERMNILSADLNTRRDGIAVDTLHLVDETSGAAIDEERIARVEATLERVRKGETTIETLLESRPRLRAPSTPRFAPHRAPVVRINNDDSRDYTIVDVRAPDRVGLLYTITHTLTELGLDISLAKISTEAYGAVDAFYVSDETHRRIRDADRLAEIVRRLTEALEA
jgi:[protein-PII] uridylyltransferase